MQKSEFNETPFYKILGTVRTEELGSCPIHFWAAKNDLSKIKEILENSSHEVLLIRDFDGNTPLHYAASTGAYDVIDYLVRLFPKNYFFNLYGITPTQIAAERGDVRALKLLHNPQFPSPPTFMNWSPLTFSIYYGHLDAVKTIFNKSDCNRVTLGADSFHGVNMSSFSFRYCSPYDISVQVNGPDHPISQFLYSNGSLPSLHASVATHNLQGVIYHTESKISPYYGKIDYQTGIFNVTPLHVAAYCGYSDIIHFLVHAHANPTILDSNNYSALKYSIFSPKACLESLKFLHPVSPPSFITEAAFLAMDFKKTEFVKELVFANINPTLKVNDDTIITRLIKRKMFSIAGEYLKQKSPDLKEKDVLGATPLHYLASIKHPDNTLELIKLFIDSGAVIDSSDNLGFTPIIYGLLSFSNHINYLAPISDLDHLSNLGLTPFALMFIFNWNSSNFTAFNSLKITEKCVQRAYDINISEIQEQMKTFQCHSISIVIPSTLSTLHSIVFSPINLVDPRAISILLGDTPNLFVNRFGNNPRGLTILHIAVIFACSQETISEIIHLSRKMNINLIDQQDADGRTALQYAVGLAQIQAIQSLLRENANPNIRDFKGNTLYHYMIDDALFNLISQDYFSLPANLISENSKMLVNL